MPDRVSQGDLRSGPLSHQRELWLGPEVHYKSLNRPLEEHYLLLQCLVKVHRWRSLPLRSRSVVSTGWYHFCVTHTFSIAWCESFKSSSRFVSDLISVEVGFAWFSFHCDTFSFTIEALSRAQSADRVSKRGEDLPVGRLQFYLIILCKTVLAINDKVTVSFLTGS